jgi:hypothetical protein
MGRRSSFELLYYTEQLTDALAALTPYLPTLRRPRQADSFLPKPLTIPKSTIDEPAFLTLSLLFPAECVIERFCSEYEARDSEWTEDGREMLPAGCIDLQIRRGERWLLLRYQARTSGISWLFDSPIVWRQFADIANSSGALLAYYDDVLQWPTAIHPILPDGSEVVEIEFGQFILEERETYWHIDTDRYVDAIFASQRPRSIASNSSR